MKLTKLTNKSSESVDIQLKEGGSFSLAPGCEIHDANVSNLDQIRDKVEVKGNLTEVSEMPGKTRIDG